jgi:hypothetical protein
MGKGTCIYHNLPPTCFTIISKPHQVVLITIFDIVLQCVLEFIFFFHLTCECYNFNKFPNPTHVLTTLKRKMKGVIVVLGPGLGLRLVLRLEENYVWGGHDFKKWHSTNILAQTKVPYNFASSSELSTKVSDEI